MSRMERMTGLRQGYGLAGEIRMTKATYEWDRGCAARAFQIRRWIGFGGLNL